jgi:short subunit dehydrogenase-like uncharacterized protein
VSRDQAESGSCDFGQGEKPTIQVSWGDVATAFHSSGIPDIEVQFEELPAIRAFARTPWFVKSFLGLDFMQNFLKARVDLGARDGRCWSASPATRTARRFAQG